MGNIICWIRHRRSGSRRSHRPPPPQPEITANQYVFAAATPYASQYPNPNPPPPPPATLPYYQYPQGYYLPPAPYDHHHGASDPPPHVDPAPGPWNGGRLPCVPENTPPVPYVEHQKAVTIRNDANIKKETLRIVPDEENPGRFLVAFTFDAAVAGSVTIIFFAKEGDDCTMTPLKESVLKPVTAHFPQGLGQKFRQPSGTGIDFSMFEEAELLKQDGVNTYPLVMKAESAPANQNGSVEDPGCMNCQITQAVFERRDKGEYGVRVLKQILWVNGMRYELQEIYGIGNSVDDFDENDTGKECVICLSEPRDTAVLPCRHMCMCSGCSKVLKYRASRCPICRHPVERLLEMKISSSSDE